MSIDIFSFTKIKYVMYVLKSTHVFHEILLYFIYLKNEQKLGKRKKKILIT